MKKIVLLQSILIFFYDLVFFLVPQFLIEETNSFLDVKLIKYDNNL